MPGPRRLPSMGGGPRGRAKGPPARGPGRSKGRAGKSVADSGAAYSIALSVRHESSRGAARALTRLEAGDARAEAIALDAEGIAAFVGHEARAPVDARGDRGGVAGDGEAVGTVVRAFRGDHDEGAVILLVLALDEGVAGDGAGGAVG